MSRLKYLSKPQQEVVPLFDGKFTENKPIPFPDRSGSQGYSNLFYWAHLVADETGEFPLHPHEGFEIMTFVFKGSLEHYDTATKVWTPLQEGGVQVIQAGSGVKHAERITKGTELFQIWFDPDFSKSLKEPAGYQDYKKDAFEEKRVNEAEVLQYLGGGGPVTHVTENINIKKMRFTKGKFHLDLDEMAMYSMYLLEGRVELDSQKMTKDGFVVAEEMNGLDIKVEDEAELFIIQSPSHVEYQRFIDRY